MPKPKNPKSPKTAAKKPPRRANAPRWLATLAAAATQPLPTITRNWRHEAPYIAALFTLIFLFYAATAPRTVMLEDDSLFIATLHFFGVAHPPGYPAHTLLGGIFYHLLPFGSPAYKAHLFSALMGAAACAALYAIVAQLAKERLPAIAAALALAVSKTFWSQAIIAEVYTLNAFLFFLLAALAIAYAGSQRPPQRLLFAMAAVTGIGLANHYPLFLLGGIAVAPLVFPRMPRKTINLPAAAAIAIAIATPFYLWMIWRSHLPLPGKFYPDTIDTWGKFRFYFLRDSFADVDQKARATLADKAQFAKHFAREWLWQFTPAGALLAAAGFIAMARSPLKWLNICLLCGFLANSAAFWALLSFEFSYITATVHRVYYLHAYGITAIWLALGINWLANLLKNRPIILRRNAAIATLTALVVCATTITHWKLNHRANDTWVLDLARAKLQSVEPNAALFLEAPSELPVYYLHAVLGERTDLTVYSGRGLFLNNLFTPLMPNHPLAQAAQAANQAEEMQKLIAQTNAPIYYNYPLSPLFSSPQIGSDHFGFYRRANRAAPGNSLTLQDGVRDWLRQNLANESQQTDPWARFLQYDTIWRAIDAVVQAEQDGDIVLPTDWQHIIKLARQKNATARILTNFTLLPNMTPEQLATEEQWLAQFNITQDPLMEKFARVRYYLLRAQLAFILHGEDHPQYEKNLAAALQENDGTKQNDFPWLLSRLANHYLATNQPCKYLALINRYYPNSATLPAQARAQLRAIRKSAPHC